MNDDVWNSLCDLMVFASESEKDDLRKWTERKGVFLYRHAALALAIRAGIKPGYTEVSSLVRYDKGIRDLLYVYLATAEEAMKAALCNGFDVEGEHLLAGKEIKNYVLTPLRGPESALYYEMSRKHASFNDVVALSEKAGIPFDHGVAENVRELRNCTMHHCMLCLGESRSPKELDDTMAKLKKEISALYSLLPDVYQAGFEESLNRLLLTKLTNFTRISLGEMDHGIFR